MSRIVTDFDKEYRKQWRKKNKEKTDGYTKKWRANNKEKVARTKRKWRLDNAEKVREQKRQSYRRNKEQIGERRREQYKNNAALFREKAKKFREKRREAARMVSSLWRASNPDAKRAQENKRRAIKASAEGSYTAKEWIDLCEKYKNKCLCCGETKPLTADHVIPLSRGGSNWITNIQPLCRNCNSTKHTDTTDYR